MMTLLMTDISLNAAPLDETDEIRNAIDNRDLTKILSFLNKNPKLDEQILLGVGNIQPKPFPELCLAKLSSPDASVRKATAFAIYQCYLNDSLPHALENELMKTLQKETKPEVQAEILIALSTSHSTKTLETICAYPSAFLQTKIAQGIALGNFFQHGIVTKEAVEKCFRLNTELHKEKPSSKVEFFSPLYALSKVQNPELMQTFVEQISKLNGSEYSPEEKMNAALIAANLASPDGFKLCYEFAQNPNPLVGTSALQGLHIYAKIPQVTKYLADLILALVQYSKSYHIAKAAIDLSANLPKDSTSQSMLIDINEKGLNSPFVDVQQSAVKNLIAMKATKTEHLEKFADIQNKLKPISKEVKIKSDFLTKPLKWDWIKSYKTNPKAIIKTSKGDVKIELLLNETPLSVQNFIELVNQKYYDGLGFHRIVSNFVVQGGDPMGNGSGGPGYAIRSEFTPRNFYRGILGMASSGKDTEGSQFFFMLAPQVHLNGRYTAFAKVISGMEIIDMIEPSDKIVSIQIKK